MRRESLWRLLGSIERRLGHRIESLFPAKGRVQPLDVIEAIERVLTDPRKQAPWRDGATYAPNRYVIHVVCADEQQRDFLFAFLTDGELQRLVRDHAQKEGYRFLADPEFTLRSYEERIPEHPDRSIWVEHAWSSPELQSDEHEQPTLPPARARLAVEAGPDKGLEVVLRDSVVQIGRSKRRGNTVVVTDPHVSREHVRLVIDADGGMVVENLQGDDNPISIKGKVVVRGSLAFGDRLTLGKTVLVVRPVGDETGSNGMASEEAAD